MTDNIMAKRKRIKRHTMTHTTKNQATWTPLNTRRELRCSERLSRKKQNTGVTASGKCSEDLWPYTVF
jgi:hypothetical protein